MGWIILILLVIGGRSLYRRFIQATGQEVDRRPFRERWSNEEFGMAKRILAWSFLIAGLGMSLLVYVTPGNTRWYAAGIGAVLLLLSASAAKVPLTIMRNPLKWRQVQTAVPVQAVGDSKDLGTLLMMDEEYRAAYERLCASGEANLPVNRFPDEDVVRAVRGMLFKDFSVFANVEAETRPRRKRRWYGLSQTVAQPVILIRDFDAETFRRKASE